MKKLLFIVLSVVVFQWIPLSATSELPAGAPDFPRSLQSYHDSDIHGLWPKLEYRVQQEPFNLVATLIFVGAVLHTFMAGKFRALAHHHDEKHKALCDADLTFALQNGPVSFKAEVFHFLGEVEAIFGIWIIPLMIGIISYYDWNTLQHYLRDRVNFTEPMFVVVIMAIASTKPVLYAAEQALSYVARIGKETPTAWWLSILTFGPLLGSFITEPAAMTICALLLGKRFYDYQPSAKLSYATLGLLFVNISVGGTLTHFAAPPVIMIAGTWGWGLSFMFKEFGLQSLIGILVANFLYFMVFRKELKSLALKTVEYDAAEHGHGLAAAQRIPVWVTTVHMLFLMWTVINLHYPPLFVGGFLFFLAFTHATSHYQHTVELKMPLLVGFFLAGLVTHGTLQQWWISPVLSSLGEFPLFLGAAVLTAFNDNAAITFLASLVSEFKGNLALQKAVVEGAVVGGGLTVIANAPNPAGQSLLSKYFKGGVSPVGLLLGAIIPTIILGTSYRLFG